MAVRDNSIASEHGDAEPAPLVEQLGDVAGRVSGFPAAKDVNGCAEDGGCVSGEQQRSGPGL